MTHAVGTGTYFLKSSDMVCSASVEEVYLMFDNERWRPDEADNTEIDGVITPSPIIMQAPNNAMNSIK